MRQLRAHSNRRPARSGRGLEPRRKRSLNAFWSHTLASPSSTFTHSCEAAQKDSWRARQKERVSTAAWRAAATRARQLPPQGPGPPLTAARSCPRGLNSMMPMLAAPPASGHFSRPSSCGAAGRGSRGGGRLCADERTGSHGSSSLGEPPSAPSAPGRCSPGCRWTSGCRPPGTAAAGRGGEERGEPEDAGTLRALHRRGGKSRRREGGCGRGGHRRPASCACASRAAGGGQKRGTGGQAGARAPRLRHVRLRVAQPHGVHVAQQHVEAHLGERVDQVDLLAALQPGGRGGGACAAPSAGRGRTKRSVGPAPACGAEATAQRASSGATSMRGSGSGSRAHAPSCGRWGCPTQSRRASGRTTC